MSPGRQSEKGEKEKKKWDEEEEIKPYVIVSKVGKGSFATVYRGYHEGTRQQVAIKTVQRDNLTAKLFENLQSEIQILKSLSHRHITKLIDVLRATKHIYLIIEFCSGGDLTNYIKLRGRVEGLEYVPSPGAAPQYYPHPRTGGLDEMVVRSFLRQLARALKFLRNRNLIHRDIKPQNLLLNPASASELSRGHPLGVPILKIADFGFARSLPNAMLAETLCGSPLYMAPEILRYEKYDAKADLWSVGAVVYEMCTGKPPFRAMNHIELLKRIENSKGVKFPDEDAIAAGATVGGANGKTITKIGKDGKKEEIQLVPEDIKKLIRTLLKRNPIERATFDEFFGSQALANSKFPKAGAGSGITSRQTSTSGSSHPASLANSGASTGFSPVEPDGNGQGGSGAGYSEEDGYGRPKTPEHHKHIPPEVLDMKVMIPPSKIQFRRTSGDGKGDSLKLRASDREKTPKMAPAALPPEPATPTSPRRPGLHAAVTAPPTSLPSSSPRGSPRAHNVALPPATGNHGLTSTRPQNIKPLSTEGSIIPGETEEDGALRREYVFIGDTRAVEFNRAIDELNSDNRRRGPLNDREEPSSPTIDDSPGDYYVPGTRNTQNPTGARTSFDRVIGTQPITFPPAPSHTVSSPVIPTQPPAMPPAPPQLSSSPSSIATRAASNALHKAISLATRKLFGTSAPPSAVGSSAHSREGSLSSSPTTGSIGVRAGSLPSSPRRPPILLPPSDSDGAVGSGSENKPSKPDPMEEELLASLEDLAQKTEVLTRWADEMYEYVKAIPQKPLPDPSKFTPLPSESPRVARRRKLEHMEAEYNAVTCVAVYILLMSFAQKGIDKLRVYQEHMRMKFPEGGWMVSEGFDVALQWFKEHFIKCNDRAALVKTWLPVQYEGPKSWLDQLVYDRALVLSRTAARKELLDQQANPDECENLYEESLWCLYALQDDLLQSGNPFMEEDRETIATWIKRTKLRLVRCRTRMAMNDRDRMIDAKADQNLAEVARIPAPWEVTASPAVDGLLSPGQKQAVGVRVSTT